MGNDRVVIDLSEDDENATPSHPSVSKWTSNDVAAWICKVGYKEYSVSAPFV